jgi:serine protease Do
LFFFKQKLGLSNGSGGSTTRTEKIVVEESSAVVDANKKISPAVVSISSKRNVTDLFGQVVTQEADGTGFIITSDGLIVTNKHVVSDQNAGYTVFTSDGKDYPADVLARDPLQDLAVLKIKADGLPVVDFGDSDQLQVGQFVIAIGNALGQFQNSLTLGVISAKERQIVAGDGPGGSTEKLEGLLQTDAAINQGNSGGPLVNLKGQVIGVNTAVAAKGQAEGIGFAIPINAVKNSINQVKKTGKIVRPYLGVRYVPLTKEIAQVNKLPTDQGAYVIGSQNEPAVIDNSPASKAGVKERDIITEINGDKITDQKSLTRILSGYNINDTIDLTILRDGKTVKVKVTLEELK